MLTTAVSTFGIIFLAELPDKTALAALVLGTRLPTRAVVLGGWLAFFVQTVIAVGAGSLFSHTCRDGRSTSDLRPGPPARREGKQVPYR